MSPPLDSFARTIRELHGRAGVEWLNQLPTLLTSCQNHWSLTIRPAFRPLSYNYVAPATRQDGSAVVLKVGVPHRELRLEIEALRVFDGRGCVQLLDSDWERGILLLEQATPGKPLSELDDDEKATSIAARTMRELWQPAPARHKFPTVPEWFEGIQRLRLRFDGGSGPLPARLVEESERLLVDLLASAAPSVLLHGDLHHDNIVSAEREPWLAIDPKGIVGEPAYETGALLRNIAPQFRNGTDIGAVLDRRIHQLAGELQMDADRIRGWGISQAVLSACWSLEDHGHGWEWAIQCAQALSSVPG